MTVFVRKYTFRSCKLVFTLLTDYFTLALFCQHSICIGGMSTILASLQYWKIESDMGEQRLKRNCAYTVPLIRIHH